MPCQKHYFPNAKIIVIILWITRKVSINEKYDAKNNHPIISFLQGKNTARHLV